MIILHTDNLIIDKNEIKIAPITNNLNSIDTVQSMVRKVIKNEEYQGKILSITNYLFNDDQGQVLIGSSKINNIRCPYRDLTRKI